MQGIQLISCFVVQFLVLLSENVLKNCVIIVWLLLMKLKCTFKYEKKLDITLFYHIQESRITQFVFSTCTFKKVAIIHCRSICLIHFQKKKKKKKKKVIDVSEVISLGN